MVLSGYSENFRQTSNFMVQELQLTVGGIDGMKAYDAAISAATAARAVRFAPPDAKFLGIKLCDQNGSKC